MKKVIINFVLLGGGSAAFLGGILLLHQHSKATSGGMPFLIIILLVGGIVSVVLGLLAKASTHFHETRREIATRNHEEATCTKGEDQTRTRSSAS